MNSIKSGVQRLVGLLLIGLVVAASLSLPHSKASPLPVRSVDIIANSAALERSGDVMEACVITVQGITYPMQLGSCKELGESVLQQLQAEHPTVVFNLTVNGFSYNTV